MMGTPLLQDPKPLTENEDSKKQKASLPTSSFFTQNLRCLTFRASENFTIEKALKDNIKRFLPRDHVYWNNRTVQNTIREKLSMVTSGNGKY